MCELDKRGVIAAQICSDAFIRLGTTQAKVFGVPDLPFLIIPHPLGGLSIEKVEERAQAVLGQLTKLIEDAKK